MTKLNCDEKNEKIFIKTGLNMHFSDGEIISLAELNCPNEKIQKIIEMFFEYLNSYLKNPQFVFLLLNLARLSKKHNCSLNNQIKWLSKLFQIRIGISLIIR